jgi:hypothetical protein
MRIHQSYAVGWRIMVTENEELDTLVSEIVDVQEVVARILSSDYSYTITIAPVRISQSNRLDGVTEEDITNSGGYALPLSAYPVGVEG